MNKRIEELAEQCTTIYNSTTFPVDKDFDYEKFAELIIRECSEICRRQQYYDADDEYKRGVNSGSDTCMNAIKQYFGITE